MSTHEEGTPRAVVFGVTLTIVATVMSILIVLASLVPAVKNWFGRDLTLTVEAESQSVLWRTGASEDEPQIIALPPGEVMQQQVADDFSVKMVGTQLSIPAIEAKAPLEIRIVSRGPCAFDLTAKSLTDAPIAVYDRGEAIAPLAAKEVVFVMKAPPPAPVSVAPLAALAAPPAAAPETPCGVAAGYDFFLDKADTLEIGEGVGASEIPTQLVAGAATALSGKIAAHNRAWLFDTRYDLGSTAINRGDFVRVMAERARPKGSKLSASGVVSFVPADGALHIVAYAAAAQAEVEHFGGKYAFKATTWQTIASQPSVQFFFSALAAMLGIMGFVMGIKKWRRAGLSEMAGH